MPARAIATDLVLVIVVKLAIVITAALFVFGPRQLPEMSARSVETRLIGVVDGQNHTETAP
jgi:hypothetical protein